MNTTRKMVRRFAATTAAGALGLAALAPVTAGAEDSSVYAVTVTVENLAPADGTIQTPFWIALQDGSFDTYDRGAAASAALESRGRGRGQRYPSDLGAGGRGR